MISIVNWMIKKVNAIISIVNGMVINVIYISSRDDIS